MRRSLVLMLLVAGVVTLPAQDLRLPMKAGSLKFAVIGDTGTGDSHQIEVANQLATFRSRFQFPMWCSIEIATSRGSRPTTM